MLKKEIKIWLEDGDLKKLKAKAEDSGFEGRGAISHYVRKIAAEPIVFISKDIEVILKLRKEK